MTRNQAMRRDDMVGGRNDDQGRYGRQDEWSDDGYELRPGYHHGRDDDGEQEYDPRAYAPNPEEPYGYDDDGNPIYYEPEPRKLKPGRNGLLMVGAVLAVALVGGAGAVGYKFMSPGGMSGEPPLIKAETEPVKSLPKSTGDETPAQNKAVYDRVDPTAGPKSKVVSREEEPVDLPSAPSGENRGSESSRIILPGGPAAAEPVAPGTNGSEPRKVKTVAIRPNEPAAPPPGPSRAEGEEASLASIDNPQRSPAPAPRPQPQPTPPAKSVVTAPVRPAQPAAPRPADPSQVAAVAPRAPAPAPTATTAPAGGGFVVQVTSQRSEADARAAYANLQKKFPGVLGPYKASIATATVADRGTYYRVRVGPFANGADASKVCGNLRSAGGECVVSRN
ncbi:SPOR domain-containing protein [Methylopila sp. M107]|uniref:SPOR domain-containing protein n=1 Tax=Methylopila sp. M107 TaxID=1101190 RepID=UPI00037550C7|nr:SPOR domain-containing protein [Methylopila sp. M107]